MTSSVRNLILWVIILILVVSVYAVLHGVKPAGDTPGVLRTDPEGDRGQVESVTINAATGDIQGKYKNHDEFRSTMPPGYNDFYSTC